MREGKLTVEKYFSNFKEFSRLSGKHMSTEDKIATHAEKWLETRNQEAPGLFGVRHSHRLAASSARN